MAAREKPAHKTYAPPLLSGLRRLHVFLALPPHQVETVKMIAAEMKTSVSYLLARRLYESFGFEHPPYRGGRTATVVDLDKFTRLIRRSNKEGRKIEKPRKALVKRGTQIIERASASL